MNILIKIVGLVAENLGMKQDALYNNILGHYLQNTNQINICGQIQKHKSISKRRFQKIGQECLNNIIVSHQKLQV